MFAGFFCAVKRNFPPPRSFFSVTDKQRAPDDWTVVQAVLAGKAGAFQTLVRRYERQVANIIYLSLGNREDVEDLSQEVFLRLYQSLPRLNPQRSLFSWIYRITANLCIDEIRRRKIKRILSLEFLIDEGRSLAEMGGRVHAPDRILEDQERRHAIVQALQNLPGDHRLTIVLREYEDLSYEEIADALQISVPAVKSRLFRARERLRALLEPHLRGGS